MSGKIDILGQIGLQYFGRTTAAITHEMKNALAIINENAGLLNDYMAMMEKGMPVDPERMKTVAGRIAVQTGRSDGLIKHLNQFAHTADEPLRPVDLNEAATLLASVSHREVAMRQAELVVIEADEPVAVNTAPFLLLSLLGHCLTFGLGYVDREAVLELRVAGVEKGGTFSFNGINRLAEMPEGDFPGEKEKALLVALNGAFSADTTAGRFEIQVVHC